MRDGVVLRANILRLATSPRGAVLVFRTPYNKDEGDPYNERTFQHAVERGYAVVVQDVRGRHQSEGEFDPYRQEGRDGYDTIEWAAAQPWSDGRVGTFGLSYPGAVQWLAAVESPPHLKAMVPAMTFSTLRQCVYFGGLFDMSWTEWAFKYIAPSARARKNLPGLKTEGQAQREWNRLGAQALQGYLPLLDLPNLRDAVPFYDEWIRHQPFDPWWDWGDLRGRYGATGAAVLNLSGWHDEPYGAEAATTNFLGLVAARKEWSDPRTGLLIGPWSHGVQATDRTYTGDRAFGAAARIDYDAVVLDWLDRYVRGISRDEPGAKPVRVFVMGDNRWREMDTWPPPEARLKTLVLGGRADASPGEAGANQTGAHWLDWQPAPGTLASSFVSDPRDPVPDRYETNFGPHDLSYLLGRPDVLAFDSRPLQASLEVTGNITAEMYVSSDAPDFDLYVMLADVHPDGQAFNVMSAGTGVLRVSYRDRTSERKLLSPGQVVKLVFDNLRTANAFRAGHRVRLYVLASWYPSYPRNLQTGELETTGRQMRSATIHIHHDEQHRSRLSLPIMSG